MAITVNRHRLLELRVRTARCIIATIPLVVNRDIREDFNRATFRRRLEGVNKVRVIARTNLSYSLGDGVYTADLVNYISLIQISCRICIEVSASDVQLGLFNSSIVKHPCVHASAENTASNIDDRCTNIAAFILVVLGSKHIEIAIIANRTIVICNPFTAEDVDRAARGHSDKAALHALTITTVYINNTAAACADKTAIVTIGTIHVDFGTVINVDG